MQALRNDPSARRRQSWDSVLLLLVAALSLGGYVMMGSASMDYAADKFDNPFYHVIRHGIYLTLGLAVLACVLHIPVAIWESGSRMLLAIGILSLVLVLVPGVGREVNGATRWIGFGFFNVQPSELMKFFFVLWLAGYIPRFHRQISERMFGMGPPIGMLVVVMFLLLLEPDFGAAVVIAGAAVGMLFVAGARLLPFLLVIGAGVASIGLLAIVSPYRMKRLVSYMDPWSDQYSSGYQLVQALIAFGRGELGGVGLGNSVQKLFYLPEAHTDFVFAIIAEELGLIGGVTFIALFGALIARILWVSRQAVARQQYFGAHACVGIALLVAAQVFINVGVNAGLLPTKGLTLPFLSYGGSSLLILFAMMGFVLRVESELRHGPATVAASIGWRFRRA